MTETAPTTGGRRSEPLDRRHLERRQLTARSLLPAVERLLEREAYPELSVEQLVTEAEISRSTFYNYFKDKSDLLQALAGDVMSTVVDATRMWWMLPASSTKAELHAAVEHLYEIYHPHAGLMGAVADSLGHDEAVRAEFMSYMASGREGIADHIRMGQKAGAFRHDIEPDACAGWLTWMLERGLSQMTAPDVHDPERVVSSVVDILWKALR